MKSVFENKASAEDVLRELQKKNLTLEEIAVITWDLAMSTFKCSSEKAWLEDLKKHFFEICDYFNCFTSDISSGVALLNRIHLYCYDNIVFLEEHEMDSEELLAVNFVDFFLTVAADHRFINASNEWFKSSDLTETYARFKGGWSPPTVESQVPQPPQGPDEMLQPQTPDISSALAPKRRGRQKGSKNKPKPAPQPPQELDEMLQPQTPETSSAPAPKRRGRQKGSKNKPKPPQETKQATSATL
jgi:hypothetical protein